MKRVVVITGAGISGGGGVRGGGEARDGRDARGGGRLHGGVTDGAAVKNNRGDGPQCRLGRCTHACRRTILPYAGLKP